MNRDLVADILCHNYQAITAYDSYLANLKGGDLYLAESIKKCEFKNGIIFDLYVIRPAEDAKCHDPPESCKDLRVLVLYLHTQSMDNEC